MVVGGWLLEKPHRAKCLNTYRQTLPSQCCEVQQEEEEEEEERRVRKAQTLPSNRNWL